MSWEASVDVAQLSRAYGFHVVDYGADRGPGVCLAVGAGAMLATMDLLPCCRYAIDLGPRHASAEELTEWLVWIDRLCDPVVVNAWFSISDPATLRSALEVVDPERLFVCSNVDLGRGAQTESLDALAHLVRHRPQAEHAAAGDRLGEHDRVA